MKVEGNLFAGKKAKVYRRALGKRRETGHGRWQSQIRLVAQTLTSKI